MFDLRNTVIILKILFACLLSVTLLQYVTKNDKEYITIHLCASMVGFAKIFGAFA